MREAGKLTVWHLSSNRWNSAITEYALSAARATGSLGHRVVFSPLAGSPAERRARAIGLEVSPFPGFGWGARHVFDDVRAAIRPDVIMVYGGPETVLSGRARGSRVLRFRGQDVDAGWWMALRHRLGHRHVSVILTPSDVLARKVRALGAKAPVESVMLGVDEDRFHLSTPPRPRLSPPEVVLFGRFDPIKGHAAALAMHAELLSRRSSPFPRPVLHIVGEPANVSVAQLAAEASRLGLVEARDYRITAARIDDVAGLMSTAAVGIVSSLGSEAICRVAQEFLLCGTPVVVSGAGALDEVLFDGAGASYRGLSEAEGASLLAGWIDRSMRESDADRRHRATEARRRFSIESMALRLAPLLS